MESRAWTRQILRKSTRVSRQPHMDNRVSWIQTAQKQKDNMWFVMQAASTLQWRRDAAAERQRHLMPLERCMIQEMSCSMYFANIRFFGYRVELTFTYVNLSQDTLYPCWSQCEMILKRDSTFCFLLCFPCQSEMFLKSYSAFSFLWNDFKVG